VPDPICKSNLENTREWVDQAYRRLSSLDGAGIDKELYFYQETQSQPELKNLEAGLDAMKKAQKFASIPFQTNKIKDGRNRTLKVLLNDISSQMPLVENHLLMVKKLLSAGSPRFGLQRQHSPWQGGSFAHCCGQRSYTKMNGIWNTFRQQRQYTAASWAKMKNVTFTTKLKGHEDPLRELAKDGCVARS
jgi:hypothetical protein